jgi:hypothetical protein
MNSNENIKKILNHDVNCKDLLQLGLACHIAGDLTGAAAYYCKIVSAFPDHALANHNLGLIELSLEGPFVALGRFSKAVEKEPMFENYWISYIRALILTNANDIAYEAIEVARQFGISQKTIDALAVEVANKVIFIKDCTITTLIPAYKVNYIIELLECLVLQSYKKFKVIISDDSPNGEVTQLLCSPSLAPLLANLNFLLVQGPRKGAMSNTVNLINLWCGSTPLVHVLMDDDLIYPNFYSSHVEAHNGHTVGLSVSYRWYSDEKGRPFTTSVPPDFIHDSVSNVDMIGADQLFASAVPGINNWLGELSNAVLSAENTWRLAKSKMQGISYYGLGDLGIFLQASCSSEIAIIKNYLGCFRQNSHQNTLNLNSTSLLCGFIAWIVLGLVGYKYNYLTATELQVNVNNVKSLLLRKYPDVIVIQELVNVIDMNPAYSTTFEENFQHLWTSFLNTEDWIFSQQQIFFRNGCAI